MAEEVGQLEGLFEFLEEHFDAPAAAIEVRHTLGAPRPPSMYHSRLNRFSIR
jgi:hypothetical protein